MDIGFRGSFFAHGVFDPNVVASFEFGREKSCEPFFERFVRKVGGRDERYGLLFKEGVERVSTFDRADAFVVIEGRQESERVFEPILAFHVHFYSETLSKRLLVVYFSSMAEERHLQACHGAVVRFLVEERIGHALRFFLRMPLCYGLSRKYKNSGFRFRIPDVRIGY